MTRLLPLCLLVAGCSVAKAEPADGLFFEQSTGAEGVTVRRMRDRSTGAVCYVATGRQIAGDYRGQYEGRHVAIVCLPSGGPP